MAARQRLYFLDNLRYLCEWSVIIFHTAVGYAALSEFYIETESSHSLLEVRHAMSLFGLPLLFVVAGFFSVPSLEKHGTRAFLTQRLRRLGLPFLVGIFFLGPLMPWLGYYAQSFRGLAEADYLTFWLNYIQSGFSAWHVPEVMTTHPRFHHQHFYFLSLLLQIVVVWLLSQALWDRFPWRTDKKKSIHPAFTGTFLGVAIGLPLLHFLAARLHGPAGVFAFLFYFSLTDFLLFGGCFALGVWAYRRGWFRDGALPGWQIMGVLTVVLLVFHQGGSILHAYRQEVTPGWIILEHGISGSLLTWLIISIMIFLAARLMNRPSTFNSEMAASAFHMYLLQYPVILILRFPLLTEEWPAWIKFLLVVPLTVLVCWAISRWLIQPRPKTAVLALVVLTVVLWMTGMPRWGDSHLLVDRRPELLRVVPEPEGATLIPLSHPAHKASTGLTRAVASPIWRDGVLFVGHNHGGLVALTAGGEQITQNAAPPLRDLVKTPNGGAVGIDDNTQIVRVDPLNGSSTTLPLQGAYDPQFLVADGDGGIFFSGRLTSADGPPGIWYREASGSIHPLDLPIGLHVPMGLALSQDGRLFVNDAEGMILWVTRPGGTGKESVWKRFGSLFRGDRRYGKLNDKRIPSTAAGMAVGPDGRLFVATKPGVQVFSAEGRFLGLVSVSELLPLSYYPMRARRVCFGGSDGRTLFTSYDDQIYAVTLAGAKSEIVD